MNNASIWEFSLSLCKWMRRLRYKYRVRKWWSLKFYEADYFKQLGMIKSLTWGCEHHVSLIVIVFFCIFLRGQEHLYILIYVFHSLSNKSKINPNVQHHSSTDANPLSRGLFQYTSLPELAFFFFFEPTGPSGKSLNCLF